VSTEDKCNDFCVTTLVACSILSSLCEQHFWIMSHTRRSWRNRVNWRSRMRLWLWLWADITHSVCDNSLVCSDINNTYHFIVNCHLPSILDTSDAKNQYRKAKQKTSLLMLITKDS